MLSIPTNRLWRSRPTDAVSSSSRNNNNARAASPPSRRPGFHSLVEMPGGEEVELRSLNASMDCLASIFPDVQPEVFREMLSTFSEESRLQLVTECLLKHKAKWVKGRWRLPEASKSYQKSDSTPQQIITIENDVLPRKDRFRSSDYKMAVKDALYQEFRNISHSAIKAILAEHNFSYGDSRQALISLMAKSWRISVTNFILRRRIPALEECPLIKWSQVETGASIPILIYTKSKELNDELECDVISPLRAKQVKQQLQTDLTFAQNVNEAEAEAVGALYECQCCFTSNTFEHITVCDSESHVICQRCIRNTMNEALFGQGWLSSVDNNKCTMNCIALAFGKSSSCIGCLPRHAIRRALLAENQGQEIWQKFEDRTATEAVSQSGLVISSCPLCPYAEVIVPPPLPDRYAQAKELFRHLPVPLLGFLMILLNPLIGIAILVWEFIRAERRWAKRRDNQVGKLDATALKKPNFGTKFICRNPKCLRSTCSQCLAPWIDTHICHQSTRQALRTYIESAVTDAIKRTCPKCNLSFVKSSGCNKLVCVCGYSMCYVCRQDVGKEGYSHFCPHFRTNPGQACDECDRCDLYRTEDEDKVIAKAKQNAIAAWKVQRQGGDEAVDIAAELDDCELTPERSNANRRDPWSFT